MPRFAAVSVTLPVRSGHVDAPVYVWRARYSWVLSVLVVCPVLVGRGVGFCASGTCFSACCWFSFAAANVRDKHRLPMASDQDKCHAHAYQATCVTRIPSEHPTTLPHVTHLGKAAYTRHCKPTRYQTATQPETTPHPNQEPHRISTRNHTATQPGITTRPNQKPHRNPTKNHTASQPKTKPHLNQKPNRNKQKKRHAAPQKRF